MNLLTIRNLPQHPENHPTLFFSLASSSLSDYFIHPCVTASSGGLPFLCPALWSLIPLLPYFAQVIADIPTFSWLTFNLGGGHKHWPSHRFNLFISNLSFHLQNIPNELLFQDISVPLPVDTMIEQRETHTLSSVLFAYGDTFILSLS